MKNLSWILTVLLAMPLALLIWSSPGYGGTDSLEHASGKELAKIVQGGLLYDNWYKQTEAAKPRGTHPAYPKAGKKKGASTWRCKECHGWDYMGKDGAYAKGSHYSGISGLRGLAGGSTQKVVAALKDKNHRLGDEISAANQQALATFVVDGQIDMDKYIDRKSKMAKGNLANGDRIYNTICVKCHGADGKKINFKDEKKPEYLGTVAKGNPWETLHKIRMGQPAKEMPSMLAFPIQVQVDALRYAQTLPAK